jgi:hypothetical protein
MANDLMNSRRYFALGILFAVLAVHYANQVHFGEMIRSGGNTSANAFVAGSGVDSAADGGAIGFSILSATCLILASRAERSEP